MSPFVSPFCVPQIALTSPWELNWGDQVGPLNHSWHTVQLSFPPGTNMNAKLDEVYDDLKTFARFNRNHNTTAEVRPVMHQGVKYMFFDALGLFGLASDAINPLEVPVRVWSDSVAREVYADTTGAHMLVGQRRWSVRSVNATTIEVMTESFDYVRDTLNLVGMLAVGAEKQIEVWDQYLQNIRDHHVAADGAVVAADVTGASVNLGNQPSPWAPVIPYPGVEI